MTSKLETTNLVKHYFNICNTALATHRNSTVYGTLLAVLNELASGKTILLKVAGADGEPQRCFTTRFVDGAFRPVMEANPNQGEAGDTDAQFFLERSFLETVVLDADDYIENPEKLNWGWLRKSG